MTPILNSRFTPLLTVCYVHEGVGERLTLLHPDRTICTHQQKIPRGEYLACQNGRGEGERE